MDRDVRPHRRRPRIHVPGALARGTAARATAAAERRDVTAVGRYAEKLETMSAPAAGSTKSTTKVDRDAEIAAPAEHVNTKGCIGKDKIRGALQVTMAGFGVGLFQVVKHYESTTSTDARIVL